MENYFAPQQQVPIPTLKGPTDPSIAGIKIMSPQQIRETKNHAQKLPIRGVVFLATEVNPSAKIPVSGVVTHHVQNRQKHLPKHCLGGGRDVRGEVWFGSFFRRLVVS
jgi:hypothetical protein